MKSIKGRFEKYNNENVGDYISLARAVKGQGFTRPALVKAFNEMVPKEQYHKSEVKGLIDHLEELTNIAEDSEFRLKNPPTEA